MDTDFDQKVAKMGKKQLGIFTKDNYFIVHRNYKKHYFRLYKGYAMNAELLDNLIAKGIKEIRMFVKYPDKREKVFICPPHYWKRKGIPYMHKTEKQYVLRETDFARVLG